MASTPPGDDTKSRAEALVAAWRPVLTSHAREIADLTALLEPETGWYWQPLPVRAVEDGTPADPPGGVDVIRIIRADGRGIQLAARLTLSRATAAWNDRTGQPIDDIVAFLQRHKPVPPPPPGLIQLQVGPPSGLPFVPPAFGASLPLAGPSTGARPARGPALGVEPPRGPALGVKPARGPALGVEPARGGAPGEPPPAGRNR